jgi:predicted Zn-dependent peptidase
LLVVALCAQAPRSVRISYKTFTLKNGLRVILSEDKSAPTYSIVINYNVGSRDEREGRTGFAHLFEHMMFEGSENIGKGEHYLLVFNNGGGMNGTTSNDRTVYFQTLPSNQLDLGLFLESDRMRSLVINQANLDNQRNAVQEERRIGVDNRPYGKAFESMDKLAYDGFPYKHSVIGSMEDLNAATVDDVSKFFKTYYAPNNAVLTIVGDFDTTVALAKVKQYFEAIPAQPAPPKPDMTEPEQKAERRLTIDDPLARQPLIYMVYKIPPGNTADFFALDMLSDILVGGQSSRLYQKLVKEKEVAGQLGGGAQERVGTSLDAFFILAQPGKDLGAIEKMVYEEIERVKNEPVTDAEIAKILAQNRSQRIRGLQSTLSRAIELSEGAVRYNDPDIINKSDEQLRKVTKADIQRVARMYLKDTNRSVIIALPKPPAAPPKAGE